MPSVERLKERLSQTLKAKKLGAALGALTLLAKEEPNEPSWPRRAAHLLKVRSDPRGAVAALRRALELQVDQGRVLEAIATCKSILELEPGDSRTVETLDLLYIEGPASDASATVAAPRPISAPGEDAAIDTLWLRDVVPGVRSVPTNEDSPGRITEIPLDDLATPEAESALDLRLSPQSVSGEASPVARADSDDPKRAPAGSVSRSRGAALRTELANIPLFGELDPASLHTLIRQVRVVSLSAGQVLFQEGDEARTLYVIVEGAVIPIAEGERRRKLAVLERGEFFGEIGLMAKQPRNATIEALVDTKLLAIDRKVVLELIENVPSVAQTILRFLRTRLIDRQIRTNLFFSAFAHAEREAVARQFRFLEVDAGTTLVDTGTSPDGLFVVLTGSLALKEGEKTVGELGLGDVFGGLSLIDGRIAEADVVTQNKCWLVVLGEGRFRRIMEANPCLDRILRRIAKEAGAEAGSESRTASVLAL